MAKRLYVVIPSVGRAELLRRTVANLAHQTRLPDGVVVVGVKPQDVQGLEPPTNIPLKVLCARLGLARQRNVGLRYLINCADIITFLDDDFLMAADYLEQVERAFEAQPDLVGTTGRLLADGIKGVGIPFETGLRILADDVPPVEPAERKMTALYGCNFAIRAAAAEGLRFDEALPLYGWQEDVDFTYRLGMRGRLLKSDLLAGVHLGAKEGRTSGKRLGYSQIANPVYLLKKHTIPPKLAWRLMTRNVAANIVRSLKEEAHIDRRGRLLGNLLALHDFIRGKLHPAKIGSL